MAKTLSSSPSPSSSSPSTPKTKRVRAAQACDQCRRHHRKCPGPREEGSSSSCTRCLSQSRDCTWEEYRSRETTRASSASPRAKRIRLATTMTTTTTTTDNRLSSSTDSDPISTSPPTSPTLFAGRSEPSSDGPLTPVDQIRDQEEETSHYLDKDQDLFASSEAFLNFERDCQVVANKHNSLLFAMSLQEYSPAVPSPAFRFFHPSSCEAGLLETRPVAFLQAILDTLEEEQPMHTASYAPPDYTDSAAIGMNPIPPPTFAVTCQTEPSASASGSAEAWRNHFGIDTIEQEAIPLDYHSSFRQSDIDPMLTLPNQEFDLFPPPPPPPQPSDDVCADLEWSDFLHQHILKSPDLASSSSPPIHAFSPFGAGLLTHADMDVLNLVLT